MSSCRSTADNDELASDATSASTSASCRWANIAIPARSWASVEVVTFHPSCNGPSRAEHGTRTPSKCIEANSDSPFN
ncbi:unannotated protein [freshwater metagenome]|uniref:Unannotated protein n=1 Tax=freshwater metagenome TaxID=449393 RepID=A0A6J6Z0P0_9ZZZZ